MANRLNQIFEEAPGRFISGEAISHRLGLTRAAVWKQVQLLRSKGYEIEGSRGEGYRLLGRPDLLLSDDLIARLPENTICSRFEYLPITDSTNARAMALAEQEAPHGTVVCADAQTAGRGRLGRKWISPPGLNIYMTVILRPEIAPMIAPQLTLVTAVALAQGVEDASGLSCALKWPNDLFIRGRKAGGILAEMAADPDTVRHVAIGIGLNVNSVESDFPDEIRDKATSIRIESGKRVFRVDVLAAFLQRLDAAYRAFMSNGFAALLPEWNRRSLLDGKRVQMRIGADTVRGTAIGVCDDGVLMFRRDGSESHEKVYSGEIIEFER